MEQFSLYQFLLIFFLASSFNCEEATTNTLEVISTYGSSIEEVPEIYVPPLSLDEPPFLMRLDLDKIFAENGEASPYINKLQ